MNMFNKSSKLSKDSNPKKKDDVIKEYEKKTSLMKEAAIDKLFLEDMKEVMYDFKFADFENI